MADAILDPFYSYASYALGLDDGTKSQEVLKKWSDKKRR